jgi:hypothetical protein
LEEQRPNHTLWQFFAALDPYCNAAKINRKSAPACRPRRGAYSAASLPSEKLNKTPNIIAFRFNSSARKAAI